MDIQLQTGTRNPSLRLEQIARLADGAAYRLGFVVISDWLMARRELFLDTTAFERFIDALRRLDRDVSGRARLQSDYEPDRVELEVTSRGEVRVRGHLEGHGDASQSVDFEFITDQTCLRPLIADIEALLRLPPGYGTT